MRHLEATKPGSLDGGKVLVKWCSLLGGAGAILFKATKQVSLEWGKVVVGRCWRRLEAAMPKVVVWEVLAPF